MHAQRTAAINLQHPPLTLQHRAGQQRVGPLCLASRPAWGGGWL